MKHVIVLFLGWLLASSSFAQTYAKFTRDDIRTINIAAPEWEDFTNADGTGLYWEVVKAVYEPLGIQVKASIIPWNRGVKMVTKYGVMNAIIGENKKTNENFIFPDYAIDVEYMSVISLESRNLRWNGMQDFTGRTVGWMKNYNLVEAEHRDFDLFEYRYVSQGVDLLQERRLDFMIEEWDEFAEVVAKKGLDFTSFVIQDLPEGTDVYVAFVDSPLSKTLIEIYNERIVELYNDQTLQGIYSKWQQSIPRSIIDRMKAQQ